MNNVPPSIHLVTLVWGVEYIEFFLDYSLKSQLVPQNLPKICDAFNLIYKIHTDQEGYSKIIDSESYKQLSELCKVEFNILEIDKQSCPYSLMMDSHKVAVRDANQSDAAIIIGYPDVYYVENFFANLIEPIRKGKRAIFISAIRVIKEKILKKINSSRKQISSNELKKIALSSIFIYEKLLIECHQMDLAWSSLIFFKLSKQHFFFNSFNPNLFYFWPRNKLEYTERKTIDNCDYIFEIGLKKHEFYFGDSRKFFFFECSTFRKIQIYSQTNFSNRSLCSYLYWMRQYMHPEQRVFLKHKFHFQTSHHLTFFEYLKQIKYSLFIFSLQQLYKFPGFVLKPFLYKAHRRFKKEGKKGYLRFLYKTPIYNYYENQIIDSFSKKTDPKLIFDFYCKNKRHVRSSLFLEKSIRKSSNLEAFMDLKINIYFKELLIHFFDMNSKTEVLVSFLKEHKEKLSSRVLINKFREFNLLPYSKSEKERFARFLMNFLPETLSLVFILQNMSLLTSNSDIKHCLSQVKKNKENLKILIKILDVSINCSNLEILEFLLDKKIEKGALAKSKFNSAVLLRLTNKFESDEALKYYLASLNNIL